MSDILPRPEKLNSTRSCELAALLLTLNFTPVDNQMTIATGDGIPGGRLGYWRFLPKHPQGKFSLEAVIHHGLDARQAARLGKETMPPVYPEQAVIAAAYHNYRLLVESVTHGTRLMLEPCGPFYIYRRIEARAAAEMPAPDELKRMTAHGTRNTELAAALSTLGFSPTSPFGTAVAHELTGAVWHFSAVSLDGRYQLQERMAKWLDDAWCGQDDNNDPIACMADAFYNLRQLRRGLKNAQVFVRVQNAGRSVLVRRDASAETWRKAEQFLNH